MLEFFKQILTSPFGSFGSVFAIFVVFIFLVYKAGKIVEQFGTVKTVQDSLDKIKEDLSEVKAFVTVFNQAKNPFAQSHSPISLTDLGATVAIDLHIQRTVDDNWSELEELVNKKLHSDCNPYDVQEVCFEIGRNYSKAISVNEFDIIKKYAFNNGYNLSDFDLIFGILIRDKIFSVLNIQVEEVDKHKPNTKTN